MKKVLSIEIPYGIENPSFLNFKINEGKKMISRGRLNLDGTAYISRWGEKSYDVDDADSSILFDFVNGNKSSEDVAFYLSIAKLEIDGVFEGVDDYQPPHKDSHELYLMHNFWASSMKEVMQKKKKNQKKLKKILIEMILDM